MCSLQLRLVNRTAARFAPSWPSVEPVQVLSSLPKVPLEALLSPPVEPCLVMDFVVPFPLRSLEDLRSAVYPCAEHPALMMYSPSGVFSSYPIDREVVQHGEGLRFADGSEERPAHAPGLQGSASMHFKVHRMEAFHEAVAHMTQESECDIQLLGCLQLSLPRGSVRSLATADLPPSTSGKAFQSGNAMDSALI